MKTRNFVGVLLLLVGSVIFVSIKAVQESERYPLTAKKEKVSAVKEVEPEFAVNHIK